MSGEIVNTRKSNFELMRIISMFFILVWHFIHNTNLLDRTTGFTHFLIAFLYFILMIHVNSYIVVLGYFQSEKKFRFSKVLSLNNASWFYRILFVIIFIILGIQITSADMVELLSPITLYKHYWFLATYILLYLLTPFLNKLIEKSSKADFHKLLFVLFLISSILPTIFGSGFYNNQHGHSILTFIFLYYIGAYLKKYPISESYHLKGMTQNSRKLLFMTLFFVLALFNTFLYQQGECLLISDHGVLRLLGTNITRFRLAYDNPILIGQTIVYFLYFSSVDLKSGLINKISKYLFGIYLIHDNFLVRSHLYKDFSLGLKNFSFPSLFVKIMVASIIVFVTCFLIEWLRQRIFGFFKKKKIAKTMREKFLNYCHSIKLYFEW